MILGPRAVCGPRLGMAEPDLSPHPEPSSVSSNHTTAKPFDEPPPFGTVFFFKWHP